MWGHAMMLANPQPWARLNAKDEAGRCVEVDGIAALHDAVRAGLGRAWLWERLAARDPALERLPGTAPRRRPPTSGSSTAPTCRSSRRWRR
ncbi:hypothetical protein ACFSTI_11230 [Rhizorhabdus histidinilytica]